MMRTELRVLNKSNWIVNLVIKIKLKCMGDKILQHNIFIFFWIFKSRFIWARWLFHFENFFMGNEIFEANNFFTLHMCNCIWKIYKLLVTYFDISLTLSPNSLHIFIIRYRFWTGFNLHTKTFQMFIKMFPVIYINPIARNFFIIQFLLDIWI